jgi:hypothetical protein
MLDLRAALRNVLHSFLAKFFAAGDVETRQIFTGTYILESFAVKLRISFESEMSK